jgi:hypothetical protein
VLDPASNAWLAWGWVAAVVRRFTASGLCESVLAASSAWLIEQLRVDVERQRDHLAEAVQLELGATDRDVVSCDLVFEPAWPGRLEKDYFS